MLVLIFVLSAIFFGLAFLITEKNASYLLSGYNTMSDKEKENFDIKSYLILFKKFHIWLGVSMLLFSALIYFCISSDFAGIFLATYPIIGYIFLMWKGKSYYVQQNKNKQIYPGIFVFSVLILVIIFLFVKTLKNNEIIISKNTIEITEDYGMILQKAEIKKLELINQLPKINHKINGADLETILKGNFKLENGEKVILLLNSDQKPIIVLTTIQNNKIYYSSKNKSNDSIYKQLRRVILN